MLDRIERLEDWRHTAEVTAATVLERVEGLARALERTATAVETLGTELAEQRGARRAARRARAAAYTGASLGLVGAGLLADRIWPT